MCLSHGTTKEIPNPDSSRGLLGARTTDWSALGASLGSHQLSSSSLWSQTWPRKHGGQPHPRPLQSWIKTLITYSVADISNLLIGINYCHDPLKLQVVIEPTNIPIPPLAKIEGDGILFECHKLYNWGPQIKREKE